MVIGTEALSEAEYRQNGPAAGLILLFDKGDRPSRAQITSLAAELNGVSVSHDPGRKGSPRRGTLGEDDWLELLVSGLTFDLLGLSPGPSLAIPEIEYRFNVPTDVPSERCEAIGLLPGPHIADGAHTLPVLRTLVGLGSQLVASLPGAGAVCWTPAKTAIAGEFFCKIADGWLAGGPFPALGLTGFKQVESGALQSEGLAFLTGQELEIEPQMAMDRVAATRVAARLVNELVAMRRLEETVRLTGPDGGQLVLTPVDDNRWIRVSRM